MKHLLAILTVSCVILLTVALANDTAVGKRAIEFELTDQHEKEWSWKQHWKGKATIIVLSDWKGSDYTPTWTTPLTAKLKDRVKFVALADVSLAPGFLKGYLRSRFRDAYSTPILLDWDGDVFTHYAFESGVPNVLFVDAQGIVRLHVWGKGSTEQANAFALNVEKFLSAR
jgi:hypothetical protein